MDIEGLRKATEDLVRERGLEPLSRGEFEYFYSDLFPNETDFPDDRPVFLVENRERVKEAARLLYQKDGAGHRPVITSSSDRSAVEVGGGPPWWRKRSEVLWENYKYLQDSALTLLGRAKPIPLADVEGFLLDRSGKEYKTGASLVLSYPTEGADGSFHPWPLIVYRGSEGETDLAKSQPLARLADFADLIVSDLDCGAFHAVAFLLSDFRTELPWVWAHLRHRTWTNNASSLGLANVPDQPPHPFGEESVFLEIRVGSLRTPVKDVARMFQLAKEDALKRFAGKGAHEILIETLVNGPLMSVSAQPADDRTARIRPRGRKASTDAVCEFVRPRLGRGDSWSAIWEAWKESETPHLATFTSLKSFQETFYRVRRKERKNV